MPPAASRPATGPRRVETISSRDNRWLKMFRAALHGNGLLEDGLAAIEGPRMVAEAATSSLEIPAVLCSASGERHLTAIEGRLAETTRLLRTSDRLFAGIANTQAPQGVAALVRLPTAGFDDLVQPATVAPLVMMLVGVQDPGNVGTVIRAAEAFGASGMIVAAGSANPWMPKAVRASAGSVLRLPVLQGIAPAIALAQLRVAGIRTYAATVDGAMLPAQVDFTAPSAVLIGNEGAGLPAEVERSADATLCIPAKGTVDSLNAAMAATVLLYEAARQRGFQP